MTPRLSLFDRLKRSVLIADGAMGTMVSQNAPDAVDCIESLVLTNPDLIADIHRQYVRAGANIIETNTFAASRKALARYRLDDRFDELNRAAVRLARQEAGNDVFVAGSVGPLCATLGNEAQGMSEEECRDGLSEQLHVLLDEGVDLIIFETFGDASELLRAVRLLRRLSPLPVIASMTASRSGTTATGESLSESGLRLVEAGADIIGLNCGHGVRAIETALEHIVGLGVPVSVMPNAGFPEHSGGRLRFGASEEYLANEAVTFARMGAKIIGGCCGTTPAHIEAISRRLREKRIVIKPRLRREIGVPHAEETFKDGGFLEGLDKRKIPIICEIDPPATLNVRRNVDAITAVVEAGASAVSMADNPLATVKIENLAFAAAVRRECDVTVVLHVAGRDRNLLGLQSLMLGAHLLGIESLLCVTGDPSTQPGGPSNIYDVNSIGLIRMAARLNAGKNMAGKNIGVETNFSIGAAVNPNLADVAPQLRHLKNKVTAGARFVLTQPMYEAEKIREFIARTREFGIRVFIGIMPPISLRTAEYLHHEVPGIIIPEALFDVLGKRDDPEYQRQAGLDYAESLVAEIAREVDGLYLIAPHSQPAAIAGLVAAVRRM